MTSATAGSTMEQSRAAKELDLAIGSKRVALSELHPEELQALLTNQLRSIDMRNIRGFRELHQIFRWMDMKEGSSVGLSDDVELVHELVYQDVHPLTFKSHVISVGRGPISQETEYGRYQSNERTTDPKVFEEWDRTGYVYSRKEVILLLRRIDGYTDRHGLIEVEYVYIKVPNEKRYLVSTISAKHVPFGMFCQRFGVRAPAIARDILWDLSDAYKATADELQSDAFTMRQKSLEKERLAHSIG